ncbi:hypothetical protein C1645_803302 [Glomus cerebriforme]|uniref:Protein kinase domain-containing protein n=1 Tax=Glomus cerebriforme TaxID=658196 RepID=A0A397T9G2_9GLOM|nr:hypothetical protein C1645_803302 [Glomus cerebriforme]
MSLSSNEWINKKIKDEDINYFKYDEFINLEKVGEGAFGIVNRADWKSGKIKIALKVLTNNSAINEEDNMKKFIKELKNLRRVGFHPNINQFYGTTKPETKCQSETLFIESIINDHEREYISNALDEIIQAYLRRNKLGWTKNFSFPDVLERYKSRSKKIFNYLIMNQTIRHHDVMIGNFYEGGFGVSKNEYKAFEKYKKASQQNDINGTFEVGYCYNYGYSIEKSFEKAVKSYQTASDDGLNISTYFLAVYYEFENNIIEAFKLYKKSANNGFIPSQYKLATFYENGDGTQQDKKEALKWYKLFLENDGEYSLSYNIKDKDLGHNSLLPSVISSISEIERELIINSFDDIIQSYLIYNRIGQTKSFSFSKVLEKHRSNSKEVFNYLFNNQTIRHYEVMIGIFYEKGFGVKENKNKAFEWYMKGSQQNDIRGHYHVGCCYYSGNGVKKNKDKSFEYCQRAVDNDNDSNDGLNIALYFLATFYKQKDPVKAFELYKKSAEKGFVQSQYELAKCYKEGIGIQKSEQEALKWHDIYQENDVKYVV